jgi:hypothetical protein
VERHHGRCYTHYIAYHARHKGYVVCRKQRTRQQQSGAQLVENGGFLFIPEKFY